MTDLNGESTYMAEKEKIAGAAPIESSTSTSSVKEEETCGKCGVPAKELCRDRYCRGCHVSLTFEDCEAGGHIMSVRKGAVDPARIREDVLAMPDRRKQFVANWCFWSLTMDELIDMGMLTGPRIHRPNVLHMQEILTELGFVLQDEVGPECIIVKRGESDEG